MAQKRRIHIPFAYSADELRAMYVGARGNRTARRYAGFWAKIFRLGLLPPRWVTLEVAGRQSGEVRSFPLGMADVDGKWYLVSMLGNECNWVRNVRSAQGLATIRHGRKKAVLLVEVPVAERARIIKHYLAQVPGARPHIPIDRHASVAEFEGVAADYPVFLVTPA